MDKQQKQGAGDPNFYPLPIASSWARFQLCGGTIRAQFEAIRDQTRSNQGVSSKQFGLLRVGRNSGQSGDPECFELGPTRSNKSNQPRFDTKQSELQKPEGSGATRSNRLLRVEAVFASSRSKSKQSGLLRVVSDPVQSGPSDRPETHQLEAVRIASS